MYETTLNHYINGAWVQPTSGKTQDVMNPAKNTVLAKLGHASKPDLDKALAAVDAPHRHSTATRGDGRSASIRG